MRSGDRIERYAARIDAKLRADEESDASMRVFTDSSLRRVLKECGFSRRGSVNTQLIQDALVRRGVHPDPPLTTPELEWEQRIYFTRTKPSRDPNVRRVAFPEERDLESFIEANFDLLFPGLDLEGRQYQVQSGKVDLLARDGDDYVVIELKLDRPSHDLAFQIVRYMDDVSEWLAARGVGVEVRGIVVSKYVDDRMRDHLALLAAASGRRIDLMRYELNLELFPAE